MSLTFARELVAQAAIVVALCVGAWLLVVKPKAAELTQLEQTIAESSAALNSMSPQTVENLQNKMVTVHQRVGQVRVFNQLAEDSSRLYGLVMDLADKYGVQVQHLQPGAGLKKPNSESLFAAMELDLTVEGAYQNIAGFLEEMNTLDAFIRPVSLQITPTTVNDRPMATASFGCEVLNFTLADALASIPGAPHAKP